MFFKQLIMNCFIMKKICFFANLSCLLKNNQQPMDPLELISLPIPIMDQEHF